MSEARHRVFVIAVLGGSPGVITELLWHLVQRDRANVVGIEIWTTAGTDKAGASVLMNERHLFDTLWRELGSAADLVPELPADLSWTCPPTSTWDHRSFRLVAFQRAGGPLDDTRTPEDADLVDEQLHDRVRQLRQLPDEIGLVGSLAGGRKTMGSALQTAFALHARPRDRLVHVWVHPNIESNKGLLKRFACPTLEIASEAELEFNQLMSVYDVPFPRLRSFVSQSKWLTENLDKLSYADCWLALRLAEEGVESARLSQRKGRQSWVLQFARGTQHIGSIRLSRELTVLYRLLIQHHEGGTPERLAEWADAERLKFDQGRDADSVRRALDRLRETILASPLGRTLPDFVPESDNGTWRLPAACPPSRVFVGSVRRTELEPSPGH